MLSRLLEHYPTQWLKVTISGHPLKIQVTMIPLGNCHIQFLGKIKNNNNKKTELGETEATCNSHTETTATTAVSKDASSSSIEGLVNCSSSERWTPLSRIGKKLNHGKATEVSRATDDLLLNSSIHVEMNWKLLQLCQQLDPQVSLVHPVWLGLLYGTDVHVSTTP